MHRAARLLVLAAVLLLPAFVNAKGFMPLEDAPIPERWLPLDDDGWTVVAPSADSRLIYVSSSAGDDASARAYAPGDPAVGEDPRVPVGPVSAYKTVDAALAAARDGAPDWVLLRRGDTWSDVHISARSGRSATEPSVVCAWGDAPERPVLRGARGGVGLGKGQHAVVMDLDLYCSFRDPAAPDYGRVPEGVIARKAGRVGIGVSGPRDATMRNVLVENCRIRFGAFSVTGHGQPMINAVLRRCVVLDHYVPRGHTQGLWGAYASVLLEECIFDHNGWLFQSSPENRGKPGRANPLSHNTYCTGMYSTIFRNNTFLRAASIGNKFTANNGPGSTRRIFVDNNLYVDGEIGISMGGNRPAPLRWVDCRVTNNVMLDLGRSRPTYRNLGWGLDATDWDGGTIAANLFLHERSPDVRNVHAMQFGGKNEGIEGDVHMRNVTVRGNLAYGLGHVRHILLINGADRMRNVTLEGNMLQLSEASDPLIVLPSVTPGVILRGNSYWSGADADQWFILGGERLTFEQWVAATGEPDAKRQEPQFPEPDRCIETYMESLDEEPTIDAFIAAAREQSRRNWRPEITAGAVNDWIRAGFGVERFEPDEAKPATP